MEEDGLIVRTVYPEVPPRVEYRLSKLGTTLRPLIEEMGKWGEMYREMVLSGETIE